MENKIPSRTKKTDDHVPPGSPREEEAAAPVAVTPASVANPFAVLTPVEKRRTSLAGRYRVREGYTVAHPGAPLDMKTGQYVFPESKDNAIRNHATAHPGEVVELSHEDAVSVIRHTKDQRDPKTGRANGPAIETETAYLARTAAETEHARFMAEVNGVNSLDSLDS